ncbi:PLD nuclease N-terminal domain-containing protein [Thermoclostridium caenicola]
MFREGVQNLNKWAWFLICLFVNVIGPVLFLLVGRKKEFK